MAGLDYRRGRVASAVSSWLGSRSPHRVQDHGHGRGEVRSRRQTASGSRPGPRPRQQTVAETMALGPEREQRAGLELMGAQGSPPPDRHERAVEPGEFLDPATGSA